MSFQESTGTLDVMVYCRTTKCIKERLLDRVLLSLVFRFYNMFHQVKWLPHSAWRETIAAIRSPKSIQGKRVPKRRQASVDMSLSIIFSSPNVCLYATESISNRDRSCNKELRAGCQAYNLPEVIERISYSLPSTKKHPPIVIKNGSNKSIYKERAAQINIMYLDFFLPLCLT